MKNILLSIILLFAFNLSAQKKDDVFKKQNASTLLIEKSVEVSISRDDIEAKEKEYDEAIDNLKAEKKRYTDLKKKCDDLNIKVSTDTIIVTPVKDSIAVKPKAIKASKIKKK